MNAMSFCPLLAEAGKFGVRWHMMPAAWLFWLVVVPLALLVGWWAYQRDADVPRPARLLLAGLRSLAIIFILLILFGPYSETSEKRTVRSHLLVLADTSSSMSTVDGYEPQDARALAEAAGVSAEEVGKLDRLELVKRTLGNPKSGMLEKLSKDFRLHFYGFGSQLVPLISTGDTAEEEADGDKTPPAEKIRARLKDLRAVDPTTRLGQAVSQALDAYRLRDEDVAAVLVLSDGQQNGGSVSPVAAGRKAAAQRVPVHAIGVGDPRSPKNIHVSNLRAKEVVLARDVTVFEFDVHAKGFEGRTVPIEIQPLDMTGSPRGSAFLVNPSDIVLKGGDAGQEVRVTYRFNRAETYALRIGIPVQDEEKIKSDNYLVHTLRVIDRKIKVLYVEGIARWEFHYLSNALTRDRETMLAHTLLLDSDPETPQKMTTSPEWPPLEGARGLPPREKLFEYDVVILGDVDPLDLGNNNREEAEKALANLRDFVERGGGLITIGGPQNNPTKYRDTPLAAALPILVDRAAERAVDMRPDERRQFHLRLTPEGDKAPMMNVAGDLEESRRLWETHPKWLQYWSYPAQKAKMLAKVLAVSDDPRDDSPKYGPRPLIAMMPYGRGRTLYIGVDELWRMRYDVGDRFFYRFYAEAVRFLATYRLLGGNKRFKILTDLDTYTLDSQVHIMLDVLDRDYEPSRAESQTVKLDMPGSEPGKREAVEVVIPINPGENGTYKKTIIPTRAGDYRLTAQTDDPKDEQPEKLFHVVQSSLEGRDLLLNEQSLRDMAQASAGGSYLYLKDLPGLQVKAVDKSVPTNVHEDEMWDNGWTLAIAVGLLGAEWLLRKRWRLV